MKRQRNYSEEYRRRIERGKSVGLTKRQARGHGGNRQRREGNPFSDLAPDHPLHLATEAMRKGTAMTRAARSFHLSPETLRNFLDDNATVVLRKGRVVIAEDRRRFVMPIYSNRRSRKVTVHADQRDRIAQYHSAIGRFLETNDARILEPFERERVRDVFGRTHLLETDPNTLYELSAAGEFEFATLYKELVIL